MTPHGSEFIAQAIAYLKPCLPDDGSPATAPSREDAPVCRPYSAELLICYLVDEGSTYRYVQHRHLDQAGITEDQLHQVGLHNLAGLACQRGLRVQPYQGIHAVMMGGDFEASLILLDQLWNDHFRQFVSGEYAVAIPARDVLAFCDAGSPAGIAELRELVGRIHPGGDHLLTDRLYVRRDSTWQPSAA